MSDGHENGAPVWFIALILLGVVLVAGLMGWTVNLL